LRRGFTLLEVLVATVLMAVAVAGLLSNLSTSLRNASRLTEHDRAAMLARRKMDELLLVPRLPKYQILEGTWDRSVAGEMRGGWRAQLMPFERPPGAGAGSLALDRLELEVWWMAGSQRRNFTLEGYRTAVLTPEDVAPQ
jgi:general secretion pathway protein I